MNWATERYVRIYIRDTADWLMLRWESRALLPLLLRKLDRTGVVDLGKRGRAVLGVLVGLPDEVAQPGLDGLIEDGCIVLDGAVLRSPNFVEAQTTRSSDTVRKEESRRRKQAEKQVTESDNGHPESPEVTGGHQPSPEVTLAVPSGAVPSGAKEQTLSADADGVRAVGLTPEGLAVLWNEHVATKGGSARLPLGKVAKRASRALKRFPTEADWLPGFARAKRLRDETNATWLDFAWIVHEEAAGWNLDQLNAGKFDFRFDGAGPAKPAGPQQPRIPKVRGVEEALKL